MSYNRQSGSPSLQSTPSENAEAFVCTRGGDPFSANFPAIERESIIDARYYWSGCTFNALLLILLFIAAQILLAIFASNWFIAGSSDHCRQILTGSILSSVYATPALLNNRKFGIDRDIIDDLTPTRSWYEFWNNLIPTPLDTQQNVVPNAAPTATSGNQGPLYGWSNAMDFMATGDISGGSALPYITLSEKSTRAERYHQCSVWTQASNICESTPDAPIWSLPTQTSILKDPLVGSRRYRCESHCVPVSQYRNIDNPTIPKSMTWGWGVCACKTDL